MQGTDKTWILDPPVKIPYETMWSDLSREEDESIRCKYQETALNSSTISAVISFFSTLMFISMLPVYLHGHRDSKKFVSVV
jgi:hypothetical protein